MVQVALYGSEHGYFQIDVEEKLCNLKRNFSEL